MAGGGVMIWLVILSAAPSILVGIVAYSIWRGRCRDPRAHTIARLKEFSEREKRMRANSRALIDQEPYGDVQFISEGDRDV